MDAMKTAKEVQAEHDRAEVRIKLIENGFLVKTNYGWNAYQTWEEASRHIESHMVLLKSKRDGMPKSNC